MQGIAANTIDKLEFQPRIGLDCPNGAQVRFIQNASFAQQARGDRSQIWEAGRSPGHTASGFFAIVSAQFLRLAGIASSNLIGNIFGCEQRAQPQHFARGRHAGV